MTKKKVDYVSDDTATTYLLSTHFQRRRRNLKDLKKKNCNLLIKNECLYIRTGTREINLFKICF